MHIEIDCRSLEMYQLLSKLFELLMIENLEEEKFNLNL